jgi:hypothetical protein
MQRKASLVEVRSLLRLDDKKNSHLPVEAEVFFLTSALQKLLHVCASVIWKPSLVAFFLRNSICCRRYLCS